MMTTAEGAEAEGAEDVAEVEGADDGAEVEGAEDGAEAEGADWLVVSRFMSEQSEQTKLFPPPRPSLTHPLWR